MSFPKQVFITMAAVTAFPTAKVTVSATASPGFGSTASAKHSAIPATEAYVLTARLKAPSMTLL